jgi:hypothetical protein
MKPQKKFKEFMKAHNAWKKFKRNFKKIGTCSKRKDFFQKIRPENYLLDAFPWYESKQGSNFWLKLDEKWHKYLNK